MTTIVTTCAGCGRHLTVPDRYQGRDLKCPSCGRPFRAEAPEPEPARPAPPAPPAEAPPAADAPFMSAPFDEPPAPRPEGDPAAAAPAPAEADQAPSVYWQVARVGVLSLAALSGVLHATLGLVVGVAAGVAALTPAAELVPLPHGPVVAVLAVLLMPLGFGTIGFVAGAGAAVVYNLAARLLGGVRVLLE